MSLTTDSQENDEKLSLNDIIKKTLKIDIEDTKFVFLRKYRVLIDNITVYKAERWTLFSLVFILYALRILTIRSHAVITYMLGIYYLKNVMLYL